MTNKRLYATGGALLLALALGACGGSNDNDHGNSGQDANAGATDAFFTQVLALIGTSPDNTEPVSIDGIAATSPETIEPAPL
ncbi:hypothetical protein [Noviherbaspirillum suwonense]|uniref:Lipoprotein n=1 Tax=Noviherbaspirillum suwonense TaxID=1224511 RepID=A0ABY1PV36_9BURK|nr:hypothetical protein [Noviherbaspirillum suwonense]SMP43934.1 hypothetical protein SAMN06295970_101362 [Noviherbaspirillum suwonense]